MTDESQLEPVYGDTHQTSREIMRDLAYKYAVCGSIKTKYDYFWEMLHEEENYRNYLPHYYVATFIDGASIEDEMGFFGFKLGRLVSSSEFTCDQINSMKSIILSTFKIKHLFPEIRKMFDTYDKLVDYHKSTPDVKISGNKYHKMGEIAVKGSKYMSECYV